MKREKEKVDSLPTRRADGSLESWDSPVAELSNCGIRIIIFDRKDARYNNPVSCYLYHYV